MDEMRNKSEELARKMNTVAHRFDHVDQVRNHAIEIAKEENFEEREIFLVELAALWHDIGLDYVEDRSKHAEKSAEMFLQTFPDNDVLSETEKNKIVFMLKYHDKYKMASEQGAEESLLRMLRVLIDADTLELVGERGYARGKETVEDNGWPLYDEKNPLGETYGFTAVDYDERFRLKKEGKILSVIEPTMVGQLNFQISCADLLFTQAAKRKASDGVALLRDKIKEIVSKKIG